MPEDTVFALEWTKRKLDLAIEKGDALSRSNCELTGMVEHVLDRFDHYTLGDLWTMEDLLFIRDLKKSLEELE